MNEHVVDPYGAAGVDYGVLDAGKRVSQQMALATSGYAKSRGAVLDDAFRGESAMIIRLGTQTLGFVLECLGTKSLIAHAFEEQTGVDRFDAIGFDTVAAAVNDCCCVGALPFVVNAYFATGSSEFYDGTRHRSLVEGFARGCQEAGAAWGGGESPSLSGLVFPSEVDLAASTIGIVPDGIEPLSGSELQRGDAIVLVASSGLHANGASLARRVASELDDGWATPLSSGRPFGHAILDETIIYVALMEAILKRRLPLHYASHITGHGLRKLMRADQDFTYRIDTLPIVPEVLAFLVEHGGLSPHDAYGTLNMGTGFALFVDSGAAHDIVELSDELGYEALVAGRVEDGARRVILDPIDVEFLDVELNLR